MAKKLKVPSVQHLARLWAEDPTKVCKNCKSVVEKPPRLTYRPLFSATGDMLLFNQPFAELVKGIKRQEKRVRIQEDFISLLHLVRDYFSGIRPDYVQNVTTRYYSAGRGLLVPFTPPVFYGLGGQTYLPWFSFWKRDPLVEKRLSLFTTLVREVLSEDPDLEDATFNILDFSAPVGSRVRDLVVVDAADIPTIPDVEKREMLEVFAEGFYRAQAELESAPKGNKRDDDRPSDDGQSDFFDKL